MVLKYIYLTYVEYIRS